MLPNFQEHPGLLFVVATLLPLLSFLLIFLRSGIWGACRPYRQSSPLCAAIYEMFGGDRPGRGPAYLALGAIALAFLFSLTGFVWYTSEHNQVTAEHGYLPGLPDHLEGRAHSAHGGAGGTLPADHFEKKMPDDEDD